MEKEMNSENRTPVLSPYKSAEFISKIAKNVKVNEGNISKISDLIFSEFSKNAYSIKSWKNHVLHPKIMDDAAVDWIFFVDTLNFSFWSEDPEHKLTITFEDIPYTGYFSLCAAVNRALQLNVPVTDPTFYSQLKRDELARLLQTDDGRAFHLLDERVRCLNEAGSVLLEKFNGSFVNCVKMCEKSAEKLLELIVDNFDSYKDEADYCGRKVSFYKRAQILIADIWACFEGKGLGEFYDIEKVTMFADYRIPQVLAYFGALEYSQELKDLLNKDHLFVSGDEMEVELRACSIWCVELIKKETSKEFADDVSRTSLRVVNSILIDNFLWDYRRLHDADIRKIPFHKIRCRYY